jgi:hypothetical protein
MPDPAKTDRFWRNLAIVLIIAIAANISLGYLRKPAQPPDALAFQVRQVVLAPNPKLDRILPAVDFDGIKLEQVLTDLMHQSDLNLVVLWTQINDDPVKKDVPVTMHLKNVSVATALDTVLSLGDPKHQLAWNEHGGVVTVATENSLDKSQLVVRMYDVKHILQANLHPVSPQLLSWSNTGQNLLPQQSQPYTQEELQLDEIKKLITDNVSSESWKDNGGDVGSISSFGDLLIITQSEQAQQKIEAFLQLVDHR